MPTEVSVHLTDFNLREPPPLQSGQRRAMSLDEPGMGWHAFKCLRKTWLRGKRCPEGSNNFWLALKPKTMSERYSPLYKEWNSDWPNPGAWPRDSTYPAPRCSKVSAESEVAKSE